MKADKNSSVEDLKIIPGIGKNTERHLCHIGIKTVNDLNGKDPEELYLKDCLFKGFKRTDVFYMFSDWLFIMPRMKHMRLKN